MIQMMQQAQKMQKKLKDAQEALKEIEVTGQSAGGAIEIIFDGQSKFKSIKIKPEAIKKILKVLTKKPLKCLKT